MNKLLTLTCFVLPLFILNGCQEKVVPLDQDFGVVINELLPVNISVVADQNGQYDDWIELYNKRDTVVDLSGYFLTDSKSNLKKWSFPIGTVILPDSFLIVWADADTLQSGLHANYKLSSLGETVIFLSPELVEIDRVKYPAQTEQYSFARIPNGTGEFSWQAFPTWNGRNIQIQ